MRFGYTLLKHGRKSKPTRIIVIAQRPMYLDNNYDEISIGLYCHKCNKHLIFYHLVDNEVEVVRILHQKMDIYSKFD